MVDYRMYSFATLAQVLNTSTVRQPPREHWPHSPTVRERRLTPAFSSRSTAPSTGGVAWKEGSRVTKLLVTCTVGCR